jgi:molybdopterin/thiamine biosynthesis adenylyltransferase
MYLAASGIGKLTICDFDTVDLTNLQRQIVHQTRSIGINKALSASRILKRLNPEVKVKAIQERLNASQLDKIIAKVDIVLDCSDNFETRYLINRLCKSSKTPLVSGAAIGFEGQLTVLDFRKLDSPCYACLFPDDGSENSMRCSDNGVFSPLVGIIGSTQAAEALKVLIGIGQPLTGNLLLLDALEMEWRKIKFAKDYGCKVCNRLY